MTGQPITGRRRRRTTTRAVRIAEAAARTLVTIGGLGTIVAVAGILVFLVWVVAPLFGGSSLAAGAVLPAPGPELVTAGCDDDGLLGWALTTGGTVRAFRLDDGSAIAARPLFGGEAPLVVDETPAGGRYACGFADGSVALAAIGIATTFPGPDEVPADIAAELGARPAGAVVPWGDGLLQSVPGGGWRRISLQVTTEPPVPAERASPVVRLAHTISSTRTLLGVLRADDSLGLTEVRWRDNLLTGERVTTLRSARLPYVPRPGSPGPRWLLVSERGDSLMLGWEDGVLLRFDTSDFNAPQVVEEVNLTPPGTALTALRFLIGTSTLLAGDASGRVTAWFRVHDVVNGGRDGQRLQLAHELEPPARGPGGPPGRAAPVTALAVSQRDRRFAAGWADGTVAVFHATSERLLAASDPAPDDPARWGGGSARSSGDDAVTTLALAPRDDGLLAFTPRGGRLWHVDARHPEITLATLFRPVWYEGAAEPAHVWQSSGGTDDFEPKLGLLPLVFGTLKATFYSLLFAVPIALLAAIYTSEFLPRRARARVKQAIEMMASLPSVVLGFLAALVLAPYLERVVPATLAAIVTVPLALVIGAFLWQLLPQQVGVRASGWPRLTAILATLPVALLAAAALGPAAERALFGGDIKGWLAGQGGRPFGGWLILALPLATALVVLLVTRIVDPWLRRRGAAWSRRKTALVDLAKLVLALGATLLGAALLAGALQGAGFDPRGGFLGTYVQRNALIVGFVMGFAVIPIIYTLAEDALSAVPDHLREASLAAGATRWQTATRVVVPTAMSGLFSAVMVGLGRAVGETMVVLMAAGNTPIMDWSVFNGFRTLSATIAVEMPEAVRDGTLYRVLFLAALTLFAITFVINSIAELVRQRFRRRAYEL